MTLEGGYDLPAICDCSEECVRALLDGSSSPVSEDELRRHPCQNAVDTLQKTIAIQVINADGHNQGRSVGGSWAAMPPPPLKSFPLP